ncbi:hypothetical protein JCGZ_08423 [Jatropha curcas]|uniref:Cytochrome P450 n=1 Tax=Jatropha curcas TaxID=180498 RepID=A0A067KKE1_JATCU|nr:hypothetical protein JCGZ_08423 [Jatropha curcas]
MASFHLHMWLSLLLLLLLPFIFLLKKKLNSKHLPPGPPRLPIIGNLHQLGTLPHYSLWQLSKKYGPVMLLQFGQVPTLIISSAEAAKELIKINDLNSCSRPRLAGTGRLSYNYLDIAFTPYGDYWREIKKICVLELFSAKRVQSFQSVREEEVGLFIDSILKSSSSSSPVDLSEKIMSLTANVTCRVAFGNSFATRGFTQERFQEVIHEALAKLGGFSASDFFPYVGWIVDRVTGLHSKLERSFQELDEFYQKIIEDHIQKGKEKHGHQDIVDVLLDLERYQTESEGIQFSKSHIKAIIMMVVKETLRLHPPGTLLITRETMSQFSINGYEIYPKTRVHVNAWAIGRDPKTWKNPEEFFPERFIDNSIDFRGQNYEFLPFGGGRRVCPGMTMALCLLEIALANLLFCFDWKLPGNMKEADINMEEASGSGLAIRAENFLRSLVT